MSNNALLGTRLSKHTLAASGRSGVYTCGCMLIGPFLFGLWALIASLTYARDTADADVGFYFSSVLVASTLGLFALFALASSLSAAWLKRCTLELYEHGFVKRGLFTTRVCLWNEIRKVRPLLLVYDKASQNMPPSEFGKSGEDTRYRGVYEVSTHAGRTVIISRRYSNIERIDEQLIPFCNEPPQW